MRFQCVVFLQAHLLRYSLEKGIIFLRVRTMMRKERCYCHYFFKVPEWLIELTCCHTNGEALHASSPMRRALLLVSVVLVLFSLAPIVIADTCGVSESECPLVHQVLTRFAQGNCPSGDCHSCPCGSSRRDEDIDSWCSKHGWNQDCCRCIMREG